MIIKEEWRIICNDKYYYTHSNQQFKSNIIVKKYSDLYLTIAYLLGVGKVMGSMLGPNRVIAKDVKVVLIATMSVARHYCVKSKGWLSAM